MGDLGSDSAGSALSLTAKALEAILRLMEQVFKSVREAPERKLAKIKLKTAKTDLERQQIIERLNGKAGLVNYELLRKSGADLQPLSAYMTKQELKEFAAICKREGVLISGMTDRTQKNDEGVKTYHLVCKKSDVPAINRIVNRLNDEKRIAGIDARVAELEAKGADMTEQDKVDVAQLKEEKATIQQKYCDELNSEMSNSIIEKAVTGGEQQKLTLDEALNRLTGRQIDKDIVTIVADANDPSKYIKCHGYQAVYNDKPYIKTDYEVYHGAEVVLKTHDGRFDGRPEGYWNDQKAAIQEAGQFSGTFFKFQSVVEYQKWAENVRSQNAQELNSMEQHGVKNYPDIIKELEEQLDKNGARMQDGVVVDKQTGEPLVLSDNMTEEQRAVVAEATVIGKQIGNYEELQKLETEISIAKANVYVTEEGTPDRSEAEAEMAQLQSRFDAATNTEQQLLTERKEINAVQAEQIVRGVPEKGQEVEYLPEDRAKIQELEDKIAAAKTEVYTMEESANASDDISAWKKEMAQVDEKKAEIGSMEKSLDKLKSEAGGRAKQSGGSRGEREDNRGLMTVEGVKREIAEMRAKDAAKAKDIPGGQAQDVGAKVAKPKIGKDRGDR